MSDTTITTPIRLGPFGLLNLEFQKLFSFRSVRLALLVVFLLPLILSLAPDGELGKVIGSNLLLVSGWQIPGLALYIAMQFVLPLLVAVTSAEMLGAEVAWGTLAPMSLRPVSRTKVMGSKLMVVVLYPYLLLLVLLAGSLLAGLLRLGLGSFIGGTGLGEGAFTGVGTLQPLTAFLEIVLKFAIAGFTLAPIACLAVLFSVLFLSTAAAALATVASIILMRLLIVFPLVAPVLLTTHLDAYAPGRAFATWYSIILLSVYTLLTAGAALFFFSRKDL